MSAEMQPTVRKKHRVCCLACGRPFNIENYPCSSSKCCHSICISCLHEGTANHDPPVNSMSCPADRIAGAFDRGAVIPNLLALACMEILADSFPRSSTEHQETTENTGDADANKRVEKIDKKVGTKIISKSGSGNVETDGKSTGEIYFWCPHCPRVRSLKDQMISSQIVCLPADPNKNSAIVDIDRKQQVPGLRDTSAFKSMRFHVRHCDMADGLVREECDIPVLYRRSRNPPKNMRKMDNCQI